MVETANEVSRTTGNEGEAIAAGLKQARLHFEHHPEEIPTEEEDQEGRSVFAFT